MAMPFGLRLVRGGLVLLACGLSLAVSPAAAAILITEVMSSSSHAGGAGNGDWFEIYNSGTAAVSLAGWSYDDNTNVAGSQVFGSVSIAAGGFVIVVDEGALTKPFWGPDVWGVTASASLVILGTQDFTPTGFQNFGTGGDEVRLYDATNTLVTSVSFGSVTSGLGRTFAWDAAGNSLGLSVSGSAGAYTALLDGNDNGADTDPTLYGPGSDVGSPGFVQAVPEPSTMALVGLAAACGLLRPLRRRLRAGLAIG